MRVEKTDDRHLGTLAHGATAVRETVLVCANGCRYGNGDRVRRRAEALSELVPPRVVFGYDVMTHVGLSRFLQYRQREEIRKSLEHEYGLRVSTGEISVLTKRFLDYLESLHWWRSPALREALQSDGGWPLNIDATGEDGRGTLLVAYTVWRDWALAPYKITTERADAIKPGLHEVLDHFGTPCAVMRDLGRAVVPAVDEVLAERGLSIPVLSCHRHFLADIGSDLLEERHDELMKLFRTSKTTSALRTLARDLGRKLGRDIAQAREAVENWLEGEPEGHHLPEGRDGLAVVRALVQWVLDFGADSTYGTFPFDRPWYDFHRRCSTGRRAADALLRCPTTRAVGRALLRFCRALDPVVEDARYARVAASLEKRATLFDELRDILRLPSATSHRDRGQSARLLSSEEPLDVLRDIQRDLERWETALRQRRPERGPAEETRQAIDLILAHLDRHGKTLWGHAVSLPQEVGGGIRLVPRTNNDQENFFGVMKHGERRRSGRKTLTQDFENLPPAAALAPNLTKPDYVAILCGTLQDLPAAFAELDAERLAAHRSGSVKELLERRKPQQVVETASLPAADRHIIRSEGLNSRIEKAARSRAPRTAKAKVAG